MCVFYEGTEFLSTLIQNVNALIKINTLYRPEVSEAK